MHITVEPLPPYLMRSTPDHSGMDLSAQMYHSPSSMAMQQAQAHHPQAHHRSGREMDDMMADSGFNRNWDIFGGNFKPL